MKASCVWDCLTIFTNAIQLYFFNLVKNNAINIVLILITIPLILLLKVILQVLLFRCIHNYNKVFACGSKCHVGSHTGAAHIINNTNLNQKRKKRTLYKDDGHSLPTITFSS